MHHNGVNKSYGFYKAQQKRGHIKVKTKSKDRNSYLDLLLLNTRNQDNREEFQGGVLRLAVSKNFILDQRV